MPHFFMGSDERAPMTGFYRYRKEFTVHGAATLSVNVTALGRYRLFCNGMAVSEGPVPSPADRLYYDKCDLTPFLHEGENKIEAEVLFLSLSDDPCCTPSRPSARPGFCLFGTLCDADGEREFRADQTWLVARDTQHTAKSAPFFVMPPLDAFDLTAPAPEYKNAVETYSGFFENNCADPYGCIDKYPIKENPLPPEEKEPPRPFTVVRSALTLEDGKFRFPRGHSEIELDAGQYLTARVSFSVNASAPVNVSVVYAEAYRKNGVKGYRGVTDGVLEGDTDNFRAQSGCYDPFSMKTFRFVLLSIDAEDAGEITMPQYIRVHYPLNPVSFSCSEKRYEKMFRNSIDTMLNCMHGVIMDCPYYEQQQYGQDSALQIYYSLHVSHDTRLAKKALTDLAASQMPNGLLCSNTPAEYHQCIPSFSLYFIVGLYFYFMMTNDTAFILPFLPVCDRILSYFEEHRTEEGIVGDCGFWQFVDWTDEWEVRGIPGGNTYPALTHTSMLYAYALDCAAMLAWCCGRYGLNEEYGLRRDEVRKAVRTHCYDASRSFFRDTPTVPAFSQHCQYFAVLSGIVKDEEARDLIRRTEEDDTLVKCSFCMQTFRHLAFLACDAPFDFAKALQGFDEMLEMDATTWFENPGEARSDCHGWSSAIIPLFYSRLLGIRVTDPGCDKLEIIPTEHSCDMVEGTFTTRHGDVTVRIDHGKMTIHAPKAIVLRVKYPGQVEIIHD